MLNHRIIIQLLCPNVGAGSPCWTRLSPLMCHLSPGTWAIGVPDLSRKGYPWYQRMMESLSVTSATRLPLPPLETGRVRQYRTLHWQTTTPLMKTLRTAGLKTGGSQIGAGGAAGRIHGRGCQHSADRRDGGIHKGAAGTDASASRRVG